MKKKYHYYDRFILKISTFTIIITLFTFSCVPLRKQILLQDLSKKSIKQLQQTDTLLPIMSFKYLLKPRDILMVNMNNITNKGEYDISSFSATGGQNGGMMMQNQNPSMIGYEIDSTGSIFLPVIGKVKVEGFSVLEAEKIIQSMALKYIDNVIVSVRMINYMIYVIGETTVQGRLQVTQDRITIPEAIALSGGFKEFANRAKVKLLRQEGNKTHIYYINFLDQDLLTTQNLYLLPGDVIIVDPLRAKNIKNYTVANLTLLISTLSIAILLYFNLRNLTK